MPLISAYDNDPTSDGRQSERALEIRQGVQSGMKHHDLVLVPELTLPGGRRVDLFGIDSKGTIVIIEIKSSVEDFKVDNKWHEYKDFCERFYFASHPDVPMGIFPEQEGFILADRYGCEIIREGEEMKLSAATRKALMIRFARTAAKRMNAYADYQGIGVDEISLDE